MPDQPSFESLEGLRGTGKSTVAPLLAEARGAVLVATVPDTYQVLRRHVDGLGDVEARMCFYLSGLFAAVGEIARHLAAGTPVVVESYFPRCLANHRAMGARLGITLPSGLPEPVTYHLVCSEAERRRRLAAREKPVSRWDRLAEQVPERIVSAYATFPMRQVDTTTRSPRQVVAAILATQGADHRADTESVGAHPDLLPPVHRGSEGARFA